MSDKKFICPKIEVAFFIGSEVCGIRPKFFWNEDEYCIDTDIQRYFSGTVKSMKIDNRGDISLKVVNSNSGKVYYVNQEFCFPMSEKFDLYRKTKENYHVFKINHNIDFDALSIREVLKQEFKYRLNNRDRNGYTKERFNSFNRYFYLGKAVSISVSDIPYNSYIELYE